MGLDREIGWRSDGDQTKDRGSDEVDGKFFFTISSVC